MSADNGYLIQIHPNGGCDESPKVVNATCPHCHQEVVVEVVVK